MVEVASVVPPSCRRFAVSHPWLMALGVIIGFAIPQAAYWSVQRYIDSIRPHPIKIEQVVVSPRDAFGGVKITVKFLASPTKHCLRIGSHMALRLPIDAADPELDPMGGTLAGEGFGAVTTTRSTLVFHLGSTVTAGDYIYSYRRFMQCDPFKLIPFQDEVRSQITIP